MTIAHLALWTKDLENMKLFYEQHFGGRAGRKYENPRKAFESYFLSFDSGCRLELMRRGGDSSEVRAGMNSGFAHLAFSVGSEAEVDRMTDRLSKSGVEVTSLPRRTGDGYYESVIADPEGNTVEITV